MLATSSRDSLVNSSTEQDPIHTSEGDSGSGAGEDDENMVSSSKSMPNNDHSLDAFSVITKREKHLRYRTRVFAAEYVSLLLASTSSADILVSCAFISFCS